MTNLSGIIKSIQNIMREDHGVDGDAQRLSQLCWLIFLKIFDEMEAERELINPEYKSPIPEELRWRNWASDDEGITGENLLNFINNDLFPTLKDLSTATESGTVVKGVFEDSYNYMKSGTQLRKVINKLNEMSFNRKADRDQFGTIYEELLRSLQSAGNAGEFYTPRAITSFLVEMMDPKLGETVFDPACGTGGFLTSVIEHIRQHDVHNPKDEAIIKKTIQGNELKALPHMLCVTNMILHGINAPTNIKHDDSLAQPIKEIGPSDRVDCIIANPPFGGSVKDGILANFPKGLQTKETADLFLVLFLKLLKPNGRGAIVLPDGSLTGDGVKMRIREKWLTDCNLHTIIRLPKSVFAPYATVATNLLFFQKGTPTKEVWYYEHRLPEGQKSYSKTKPIKLKEFDPIRKWWDSREESEVAWKVDIKDIEARNWDLDIKNPHIVEEEIHDTEKILERYRVNESEIRMNYQKILSDLENENLRRMVENIDVISKNSDLKPLREYILSSAISGKLTADWREQNPDVEPASKLLEQIKAEKEKLIAEKKIKKEKPLPSILEEEIPFDLPESWEWCRLGDVGFTQTGTTPPTQDKNNFGEDIPFIKPADIKVTWEIDYENEKLSNKGLKLGRFIESGSAMMVCIGGSIGKSGICSIDVSCNQQINTITPLVDTNSWYIQYLFQSPYFQKTVWSRASGGTTPIVNKTKWETIPFPLTPNAEQEVIISKVEKLMGLVDQLEKKITENKQNAELLMQAFLAEAFKKG